jgi:hypothetical protein
MEWYWNYNFDRRGDKDLNYDKFMEFSYELSEKAAPFLENCDLDNEEICKEFHNEVNKQWEIIRAKHTGKMTTDADDKDEPNEFADRIAFYLKVYHDYNLHELHTNKDMLDFDMFMSFAYDLSEKAEPFLDICDLDKSEDCFDFKTEAYKQW